MKFQDHSKKKFFLIFLWSRDKREKDIFQHFTKKHHFIPGISKKTVYENKIKTCFLESMKSWPRIVLQPNVHFCLLRAQKDCLWLKELNKFYHFFSLLFNLIQTRSNLLGRISLLSRRTDRSKSKIKDLELKPCLNSINNFWAKKYYFFNTRETSLKVKK